MNFREKVREMVRNWLQIQPAPVTGVNIRETMTFPVNAVKNRIWYRGDAAELEQLYKQLPGSVNGARFWAAAPESVKLRKIHSGLPALMVDTLADLCKSDLNPPEFPRPEDAARWEELAGEIDLAALCGLAVRETLAMGDGAFKLSVDPAVSPYPLVEFLSGDRVEYMTKRGRITEVLFYTDYREGGRSYRLCERYGMGFVRYELYDGEKQVPLNRVAALAGLRDARFSGDYLMAVPLRFYDSPRYPGRGRSIFDTKDDDFDAFDEIVSQWLDAIRAGRVKKYIPENMLPRAADGSLRPFDDFGSEYLAVNLLPKEAVQDKLETVQPDIRYEAFLSSYSAFLDLCLQGIVSPATLGIDLGKMSSAEAQREKKDVTGSTRGAITAVLEKALPQLIKAVLMTADNMRGEAPGRYDVTVSFGEYGAPSFDSRIETISRASAAGIMSVEAQVEELWGSSKNEGWKRAEIQRIREEKGLVEASLPAAADEVLL